MEKQLKTDLSSLSVFSFTEEEVKNKNIENLIGSVQIPLGIAGPLLVLGKYVKGEFYLPLATTEGALVASVSRGAKAIGLSGGAVVRVENIGATRGSVFKTASLLESHKLAVWLGVQKKKLHQICQSVSPHLSLTDLTTSVVGNHVFVRFVFDSTDAMGMNMATIAATEMSRFIQGSRLGFCISVAGNFDVDKKPSWLNFICGRGKKVWAQTKINQKTAQDVLKTTPEKIHLVNYTKNLLGSAVSGSMGFNAHYANIIAALFLSTGQDAGHIVEGSLGITTTEIENGSLVVSVMLPDLMIGTVGGGIGLPSQKTALKILGIPDPKLKEGEQVLKLGEIIAGSVLAGELSLLAALASKDLAGAHQRLGRGKRKF